MPFVLFIGRMIKDKGVAEYVEAASILKIKFPKANFDLLGPLNVENRSSITSKQMAKWVDSGVVNYLGETDDVRPHINKSHCVVLPSYREGISRVLLEACALERPIIATNVPGCRDIIDDGKNGLLCDVKNPKDLAEKMIKMICLSSEDLKEMGKRGRLKVSKDFDEDIA